MADDYQREADRSAQHLRNSENIRISELTKQERRLQPSIIVESNDEKREKEYLEKKEKLIEKVRELEKTRDEQRDELERIRKKSEFLKRQLRSYSELDLVRFENEKTEKGAELRNLKKRWHEQVMTLNALNKKLQQRVLQREAAMTKANSVVHLSTNVRDERNREIEELQKEIEKNKLKL
uniref:JAKMIP_CC3 domain-containing protein n=1 Tax=Caenorhabditis tropicalis TaxID=1561998 RepID=A0A1I7U6A4_9PELO